MDWRASNTRAFRIATMFQQWIQSEKHIVFARIFTLSSYQEFIDVFLSTFSYFTHSKWLKSTDGRNKLLRRKIDFCFCNSSLQWTVFELNVLSGNGFLPKQTIILLTTFNDNNFTKMSDFSQNSIGMILHRGIDATSAPFRSVSHSSYLAKQALVLPQCRTEGRSRSVLYRLVSFSF